MRMWLCVCTTLLIAFTVNNAYATPKVSISAKLQGTIEGRIIVRQLEKLIGKYIEFDKEGVSYKGVISQVIVPDIAEYIRTGDQSKARFRAKVEAQRKDSVLTAFSLNEEVELGDLNIISKGGIGHVQYITSDLLGDDFRRARLLAKYRSESGETVWQALVEMIGGGSRAVELDEPFIIMLNEKKDFMEIKPLPTAKAGE